MIKIHSVEGFAKEIERIVQKDELSYLEAVMHYAEKNSLEVEVLAKLITGPLKEKIRLEAYELNLLGKKTPKLVLLEEEPKQKLNGVHRK